MATKKAKAETAKKEISVDAPIPHDPLGLAICKVALKLSDTIMYQIESAVPELKPTKLTEMEPGEFMESILNAPLEHAFTSDAPFDMRFVGFHENAGIQWDSITSGIFTMEKEIGEDRHAFFIAAKASLLYRNYLVDAISCAADMITFENVSDSPWSWCMVDSVWDPDEIMISRVTLTDNTFQPAIIWKMAYDLALWRIITSTDEDTANGFWLNQLFMSLAMVSASDVVLHHKVGTEALALSPLTYIGDGWIINNVGWSDGIMLLSATVENLIESIRIRYLMVNAGLKNIKPTDSGEIGNGIVADLDRLNGELELCNYWTIGSDNTLFDNTNVYKSGWMYLFNRFCGYRGVYNHDVIRAEIHSAVAGVMQYAMILYILDTGSDTYIDSYMARVRASLSNMTDVATLMLWSDIHHTAAPNPDMFMGLCASSTRRFGIYPRETLNEMFSPFRKITSPPDENVVRSKKHRYRNNYYADIRFAFTYYDGLLDEIEFLGFRSGAFNRTPVLYDTLFILGYGNIQVTESDIVNIAGFYDEMLKVDDLKVLAEMNPRHYNPRRFDNYLITQFLDAAQVQTSQRDTNLFGHRPTSCIVLPSNLPGLRNDPDVAISLAVFIKKISALPGHNIDILFDIMRSNELTVDDIIDYDGDIEDITKLEVKTVINGKRLMKAVPYVDRYF